ncbi:MAG: hypothetical protein ACHQ53_04485 [Polyangiales bacterium]
MLAFAGSSLVALVTARASDSDSARHLGVQARALVGPALLYGFQDVGAKGSGSTRGIGFGFDFALGAIVSENLALDMDLVLARSASAEHGTLTDTAFSAVFLGGGLTYWLMPANVYLSASIGMSRSSVQGSAVHLDVEIPKAEQSRIGVGAHLALGKQFWLSRRTTLGASLSLMSGVAANPSGGADTSRYVLAAMAALSFTVH